MEEENKFCHKSNPSDMLMNSPQSECKSPNRKEGDDNGVETEETGRERLKRHREDVKGKVKIPENWGKEKMLKEWIDYTAFDHALFVHPHRLIVTARDALIADARKQTSQRFRIYNSC